MSVSAAAFVPMAFGPGVLGAQTDGFQSLERTWTPLLGSTRVRRETEREREKPDGLLLPQVAESGPYLSGPIPRPSQTVTDVVCSL